MAKATRDFSMSAPEPSRTPTSDAAYMLDKVKRDARNADTKALVNARTAIKQTLGYRRASDAEKKRMEVEAMTKAKKRREIKGQDENSKVNAFRRGEYHPRGSGATAIGILNKGPKSGLSSASGQAPAASDAMDSTTPPGPAAILRSIELDRRPGLATAPPEPVRAAPIGQVDTHTAAPASGVAPGGALNAIRSAAHSSQGNAATSAARPVPSRPSATVAPNPRRPGSPGAGPGRGPKVEDDTSSCSPRCIGHTGRKRKAANPAAGSGPGTAEEPKRRRYAKDAAASTPVENQVSALYSVVQNITGHLSRQDNRIHNLRNEIARVSTTESGDGRAGPRFNPDNLTLQINGLNSAALAANEKVLEIVNLTFPQVENAIFRLGESISALEERIRAIKKTEELSAELSDLMTAMYFLMEVLDGKVRVAPAPAP